jgi:hypothetical protein
MFKLCMYWHWLHQVIIFIKKLLMFSWFFNAKKGAKLSLPQFLKVGRAIAPSSFTHEVVLVKFELQTHMEHPSSCQSGFLVVCGIPIESPIISFYWKYAPFFHILNDDMYMMFSVCCFWIFNKKKRCVKSWASFGCSITCNGIPL